MKNKQTFDKFTWKVENFSKLDAKRVYSETFFLCGHPWRIRIYPKGTSVRMDYFQIYLDCGDVASLSHGWSRFAYFKLALINQANHKMTKTRESRLCEFKATQPASGFKEFIAFSEMHEPRGGFIVNDICIIEAEIAVCNSEHESQANTSLPEKMPTVSHSELMDFRGLGKIEKAFVPLLEEVCSWHPSLVESQKKRSRTHLFYQWAFTALGRVLHFLKTKKVKDMNNDDACNQLQVLWEELQTFGFDLTWLKPHIESALDMKNYNERAVHVKKLREKVDALETDLQIATSELVKAGKCFKKRDLDSELGYGGP